MNNRPTEQDIFDNALAKLELEISGQDLTASERALLHDNILVLAAVHTGGVSPLYDYFLELINKYGNPWTAYGDGLDHWANCILTQPRKPASPATGSVDFEGEPGALIPKDSEWSHPEGGIYRLQQDTTVNAGGQASGVVIAAFSGSQGNLPVGQTLGNASGIADINSATVDSNGLSLGADLESDPELRERVLYRMKNPSHGGNPSDYVVWTREIPGIGRAWAYRAYPQKGRVGVTFLLVNDDLPSEADAQVVRDYLNDPERAPAGADPYVWVPQASVVDIELANVPSSLQPQVTAELQDLFSSDRAGKPRTVLYRIGIHNAVASLLGDNWNGVNQPATDTDPGAEGIVRLGTISYV